MFLNSKKSKRHYDWAMSKNLNIFSLLHADDFILNINVYHNLKSLENKDYYLR